MSVLIKQIAELEARAETAETRIDRAEQDRNHWHDKAQEFKAQRDQSRRLFEGCRHERDFLTDSSLPRVIADEEVRNGQVVAARYGDGRPTGRLEGQWVVDEVLESLGGLFVDQSYISRFDSIVLLADAPEPETETRRGRVVSADELEVGDIVDVWHGDDNQEPYYPSATIESTSPLISEQFDFEGLERSFPRFQFRLLERPEKTPEPDNPWFATVYEDAKYRAGTWRGTPVRPQSINRGDLYDIHTAHGSAITGILAGRNGIHRPQSGDQYRLVNRAT